MKKALIITYYWPPMGGGGVQRWLKFVKYLREFGWEPVIFTAEGAQGAMKDESLLEEIPDGVETIRHPILEPYGLYNRLLGKKKEEGSHPGFVDTEGKKGKGWLKRLTMWIRGALFIPDARMLWIRPAARRLKRVLKGRDDIDLLISTGPPHSTHLIAEKVKRKTGLPWLADFRDPWTQIDYFHHLPMPLWAEKRHRKLENRVLTRADRVVTVSWSWAEGLEELGKREVEVITNGFDEADFEGEDPSLTGPFSITHAGSFNKDRNPEALWEAMGELLREEKEFREKLLIRSIGATDHSVKAGIEQNGLAENFELVGQLSHKEVISALRSSWVLLLPLNDTPNIDGVVPGKLYEYLGAKRPILCTGKTDGDAGWILTETASGQALNIDDKQGMKETLRRYYRSYREGSLSASTTRVEAYSRRALTKRMTELMEDLL